MSDAIWSSLVAAACLIRGLPLFFSASPKTPLRLLGIVALDTLHVLRWSRPLPRPRVHALAAFLDLAGCANQQWDRKQPSAAECLGLMQQLRRAGLGARASQYLDRLREIEVTRPSPGGDHRRFDQVRLYREAVARLSIATAAAIALGEPGDRDENVETLFRILMQCQIIDDRLDYEEDLAAGLPSFLTALVSLPQAIALTATTARRYAATPTIRTGRLRGRARAAFPLRVALWLVTALTKVTVRMRFPIPDPRQRVTERTC